MLIIDYSGADNAAATTTDVNRSKYNKKPLAVGRQTAWRRHGPWPTNNRIARLPFLFFSPNLYLNVINSAVPCPVL
ncbi:MAG: hypothetical protein ABW069_03630 [Duganella sp.]